MRDDVQKNRRLLRRDEVITLLQLPETDIEWLVSTGQLLELRIRGHRRFDSKDVLELVETYKQIQKRRKEHEQEHEQEHEASGR